MFGPIYLGEEVKIKGGVIIHGPAVIRDYTVLDNHARVSRSIVWTFITPFACVAAFTVVAL